MSAILRAYQFFFSDSFTSSYLQLFCNGISMDLCHDLVREIDDSLSLARLKARWFRVDDSDEGPVEEDNPTEEKGIDKHIRVMRNTAHRIHMSFHGSIDTDHLRMYDLLSMNKRRESDIYEARVHTEVRPQESIFHLPIAHPPPPSSPEHVPPPQEDDGGGEEDKTEPEMKYPLPPPSPASTPDSSSSSTSSPLPNRSTRRVTRAQTKTIADGVVQRRRRKKNPNPTQGQTQRDDTSGQVAEEMREEVDYETGTGWSVCW